MVTVGEYAFARSAALENVSLGDKLTSIGNNAFAHCATYNDGVFTLTLAGAVANLTMGENVFDKCGTLGVYVAVSDLEAVKAYRKAWGGMGYAQYVGLDLSDEAAAIAGTYYTDLGAEQAAMLVLGVQVLLDGDAIGVYTVSGTTVTVTLFDGYTEASGAIADGVITITLNDTAYTFRPVYVDESGDGDILVYQDGYQTGLYNGTSITFDEGDTLSFKLDNYRHTITLNEQDKTFTEVVVFEATTTRYYAPDGYSYVEITVTDEDGTFTMEGSLYDLDGRTSAIRGSAGTWNAVRDEEDPNVYYLTLILNRGYCDYTVVITLGEGLDEDGNRTCTYYLESVLADAVTVTVNDEEKQVATTVYYEQTDPNVPTGEISGFALTIDGVSVSVDSFTSSVNPSNSNQYTYTLTVTQEGYAGTYAVSVTYNSSTGTRVTAITFTPAEQA